MKDPKIRTECIWFSIFVGYVCAYWYEFQATSFVHHTKKTVSFVRNPNTS